MTLFFLSSTSSVQWKEIQLACFKCHEIDIPLHCVQNNIHKLTDIAYLYLFLHMTYV